MTASTPLQPRHQQVDHLHHPRRGQPRASPASPWQRARRRDHRAHPPPPGRALTIIAGEARLHPQQRAAHSGGGETIVARLVSHTPEARTRRDRGHRRTAPGTARPRSSRSSSPPGGQRRRPPQGRAEEPATSSVPPSGTSATKAGHLTADLGSGPSCTAPMGTGEGLQRPPLPRPLGQPDPNNWLRPPELPSDWLAVTQTA